MIQNNYSELYQKTILTHNRSPKNFGKLIHSCYSFEGQNKMCGDYVNIHLAFDKNQPLNQILTDISFEGDGCAILKASASMMTELLKGKCKEEINELFTEFRKILNNEIVYNEKLGEINIFSGLSKFPSRVQCAILSWETLIKGINHLC